MNDLIGKTVKNVRPMTKAELAKEGWDSHHIPPVIEFTDGTIAYPSQDQEGNGAGALFGIVNGQPVSWG